MKVEKSIRVLQIFFVLVITLMAWVSFRAEFQEDMFKVVPRILADPWFLATFCDAYSGFLTFFCWVYYKESSALARVIWFFVIMIFGNMAMASYALIQIYRAYSETYTPEQGSDNFAARFLLKKNLITRASAILFCAFIALSTVSYAEEISTNSIAMPAPPSWVNESRVNRVVEKIQSKLEWDIRKTTVLFYSDPIVFQNLHGFGDTVLAFSKKDINTITIGPRVTTSNFDSIFGHELVHIILYQKYKTAIPSWLDEGLANFIGENSHVDYAWLATQKHPDVRTMAHPFKSAVQSPRYQYMASQAVIEMLDSKCGLDDLLQLSVGSNLEHYLASFCGIDDINRSFDAWIKSKNSKRSSLFPQTQNISLNILERNI